MEALRAPALVRKEAAADREALRLPPRFFRLPPEGAMTIIAQRRVRAAAELQCFARAAGAAVICLVQQPPQPGVVIAVRCLSRNRPSMCTNHSYNTWYLAHQYW